MQLSELKQIIRAGVKQMLSEKKNILKIGEKPDPLHHLSSSKKFGGVKKSKNADKEKSNAENCDTCDDDLEDDVKVFHEKSDDDKHEKLEDFEFDLEDDDDEESKSSPKKSKKEKLQKENRYRLTKLLY
jgi:hypothetical protein